VFGWFYMLCLLFSIQDFDNTVASKYGQPVLQIFVDCFGETGAVVAMSKSTVFRAFLRKLRYYRFCYDLCMALRTLQYDE
jgi:hypothetical protein